MKNSEYPVNYSMYAGFITVFITRISSRFHHACSRKKFDTTLHSVFCATFFQNFHRHTSSKQIPSTSDPKMRIPSSSDQPAHQTSADRAACKANMMRAHCWNFSSLGIMSAFMFSSCAWTTCRSKVWPCTFFSDCWPKKSSANEDKLSSYCSFAAFIASRSLLPSAHDHSDWLPMLLMIVSTLVLTCPCFFFHVARNRQQ